VTTPTSSLFAIITFLMGFACIPALAADVPGTNAAVPAAEDATRAQALLDRAVEHYRRSSEKSLAAFCRAGEFIDGDLYVYVVDANGVMQASGGPSLALVGRDVRNLKDANGKLFIKEMLDDAKIHGAGSIEYRWLNREHGKVERKIAYYRKEADAIVAVGYYIPRAAPEEAKALMARAVEAMTKDPREAIVRFSDMNGGFVEDDLYVFVVGLDDNIMHAHGAIPRLIGRNVADLHDADGKPIIRRMLDIVRAKGSGKLQYTWPNPVTHKKERKTTYLRRVDGYLVAVGHYVP